MTAANAEKSMRLALSPERNVGIDVKVTTLYSDAGAEYIGGTFNKYLNSHGIHHYYLRGQNKAFKAERYVRTFRSYLKRFMTTFHGNLRNEDLQDVVASYNNNYSRAVGMSPHDARLPQNLSKVQKFKAKARLKSYLRNYKTFQKVPVFKKGDYVLLRRRLGDKFHKESDLGDDSNVYSDLFQVEEVISDYPSKSYRILNLDRAEAYGPKVPGTRLLTAPEYYVAENIKK